MANHSGKLLDGYLLSQTDGYNFHTPWLDIHGATLLNITIVVDGNPSISFGSVGNLTLQQCNDKPTSNSTGIFPTSAGSSTGNAIDQCNVPTGTGKNTNTFDFFNPNLPIPLGQFYVGYHWVRLVCAFNAASQNTTGTVNVFYHWKT